MLHANEVRVNGELERNAARKVTEDDDVLLDGYEVASPSDRYIMLYKPQGYVCSHDESDHASVLSLIELPRPEKLAIAGRLDVDTTGLVLLSDDGKWCHRITSPRHKLGKRYDVTLAEPIEEHYAGHFESGIQLHGEPRLTKPATLDTLDTHHARVELFEGRYHQVKRMFAALGNKVEALHRESIGPIALDLDLFEGEWRYLTDDEINSIYHG